MRILVLSSSPTQTGSLRSVRAPPSRAHRRRDLNVGDPDKRRGCRSVQGLRHRLGDMRDEHRCKVEDGFHKVHKDIVESDALVLVTPARRHAE